MEATMQIRRVVTGFTDDGAPTVFHDGPAPAQVELPPEIGASLVDIWRTDALEFDTTGGNDPTDGAPFALMPRGSLFRIIDLAPGDHAPMWHTTATVDFIYVASGEIRFLYGTDDEPLGSVLLRAGDTIVQRGPHHAWVNEGTETCRLVNVSVAAKLPPGVDAG
jgi:mannose-6-phosphate isomerase-like protein (cupin superfamily)